MLDQGMAPWEQNRSENREISQVKNQEELPLRKSGNALAQLPREVVKSPFLEVLKNHRDMALRDMARGHCGDGLTVRLHDLSVFFSMTVTAHQRQAGMNHSGLFLQKHGLVIWMFYLVLKHNLKQQLALRLPALTCVPAVVHSQHRSRPSANGAPLTVLLSPQHPFVPHASSAPPRT